MTQKEGKKRGQNHGFKEICCANLKMNSVRHVFEKRNNRVLEMTV